MELAQLKYLLSFNVRKCARSLMDRFRKNRFSSTLSPAVLPHRLATESTPLFRNLPDVPRELFKNKYRNLELALKGMNGILIAPGEVFSFWSLVGAPEKSRGFVEGLVIARGKAARGIGGGLCQLSNMIHWLALHSDLRVVERHRHSLDLFPDDDRKIPFGTGATVFYNYKDLRLFNPTRATFQFTFELTDSFLRGSLGCSDPPAHSY